MKREEVLQYLAKYKNLPCYKQILEYAEKVLKGSLEFQIEETESGVRIKSVINGVESGDFALLKISRNTTNNDISVIAISKNYNPQYELRYGYRTEVGLNMFTDASSAIFDENGLCIYHSWYSDDNKYCDFSDERSLDYIKTAIKKTTPKYDKKGMIAEDPESSYRPFINIWERIGKTRVIHSHGRTPIVGEYSDVGVIYSDNGKEKEKYFLKENHENVYSEENGWFGSLKTVASEIESLIDGNIIEDEWSQETNINTDAIIGVLIEKRESGAR